MTAVPVATSLAEAICREIHRDEWQFIGSGHVPVPRLRPGGPCLDCQTAASIAAERGAR